MSLQNLPPDLTLSEWLDMNEAGRFHVEARRKDSRPLFCPHMQFL